MINITNKIYYVGVNDHEIDLFEGQYKVENGMAYNSYLVDDKDIIIFDTVDIRFFDKWINNIKEVLKDPEKVAEIQAEVDRRWNELLALCGETAE